MSLLLRRYPYIDYLVTVHGLLERSSFYNYLHTLGYTDDKLFNRETIINSSYPIGVCIKDKKLLIVESATICFLEQKNGRVISVEEFKKINN